MNKLEEITIDSLKSIGFKEQPYLIPLRLTFEVDGFWASNLSLDFYKTISAFILVLDKESDIDINMNFQTISEIKQFIKHFEIKR